MFLPFSPVGDGLLAGSIGHLPEDLRHHILLGQRRVLEARHRVGRPRQLAALVGAVHDTVAERGGSALIGTLPGPFAGVLAGAVLDLRPLHPASEDHYGRGEAPMRVIRRPLLDALDADAELAQLAHVHERGDVFVVAAQSVVHEDDQLGELPSARPVEKPRAARALLQRLPARRAVVGEPLADLLAAQGAIGEDVCLLALDRLPLGLVPGAHASVGADHDRPPSPRAPRSALT